MIINYKNENKELEIIFEEEIDHHTSLKLAAMSDDSIKNFMPQKVIFDFSKVTFMDSSAIGMLLRKIQKDFKAWWKC